MEVLVASSDTDLHFEQPAAVRLKVTVVNLAHGVHVLVSDLLRHSPLIGQEELVEKPTNTGRNMSVQTDDKQMGTLLVLSLCEALVARHLSAQELDVDDEECCRNSSSSSSSPVLQQRVLWDLVVGHWLPEGVDLLKNELSDL